MVETKILVAAPTSKRHDYVFKRHWESVKSLPADFYYLDTTYEDEFKLLKETIGDKATVDKFPFDLSLMSVHQWLAHARNKIREYMLAGDYTHLFFVDSDIILPDNFDIETLLKEDKDQIGLPYSIFHDSKEEIVNVMRHPYVVFTPENEGRYDFYSWDELEKMDCPAKVHASGMGCLLIKREVLETVPFRTHPTFIVGEDIWFHIEAAEKGFEAWCYHKLRPEHDGASWKPLIRPLQSFAEMMLIPKRTVANPSDLPGEMKCPQ